MSKGHIQVVTSDEMGSSVRRDANDLGWKNLHVQILIENFQLNIVGNKNTKRWKLF